MNPDYARTLVWDGLLNADYLSRYYSYLARKLARTEQALAAAVIVLSSGALAALLPAEGRAGVSQLLSFLAALVGVYLFSSRPGRIALLCSWEAHRWRALLLDYELLWCDRDEISINALVSRWTRLEEAGNTNTEAAPVEFPRVPRLMRQAYSEVARERSEGEVPEQGWFSERLWRWFGIEKDSE